MGESPQRTDRVLLAGASGTIGRAVARQLCRTGFEVTCILRRSESGREAAEALCELGASIEYADVTDASSLPAGRYDVVISCLASRTGVPDDARRIDYLANRTMLDLASRGGARHFIYLSAICVQKPELAFQFEKLKFEADLQASGLTYSIVRPTAFFKSLSGQVARVRAGKPFLLFGNGEATACKPISDADLARYIVDCIGDESRQDAILPIGGPGPAITPLDQGRMLFELVGREPSFRRIPFRLMDMIVGTLALAGRLSKRIAAKAEYARIGRYYARESMLVWDAARGVYDADLTPEIGHDTLADHYREMLAAMADRSAS
ncbi:SDR family NAD(P)-dependent oxidoreductase [Sphingomicrobium sediminis]|uniref:Divinyl chlorophyllide a 8-vinyl-reductase, chloroplastic n=1 Tax=Sphingomicrobium sediminis TaxID=2950949 RepID=A0A9X2ENA9_9SPHN|nr:SDR family NAD(P)-dependent oxidoreductase [Sphingomicrobium sediminis]MCM8558524.1 SDR family NAD(P)-dependent oxidoreductase [Sphingomicrobium sediminis]